MIEENLIRGYIFLNSRLFKKKYYRYDIGSRNTKIVSSFMDKLLFTTKASSSSINIDYIRTFLLFSFHQNCNFTETHYRDKKMIPVNVIFGTPTMMRWLQRHNYPSWSARLKEEFVDNLDIKFDDIFDEDLKVRYRSTKYSDLSKLEEYDKKRMLNTELGFINCSTSTTLFNHQSKYCQACSFKDPCLDRLKEVYPAIYEMRGYDE